MLLANGVSLIVDEPIGDDELFVVEAAATALEVVLELARRRVRAPDGAAIDWDGLAATELDTVALALRRAWIGERVWTDALCPAPGCGQRIDVSFTVSDYLAHHRPRRPRRVIAGEDGWYALVGSDVRFRVPSVRDVLAAGTGGAGSTAGDRLQARCVQPPAALSSALARRVDRALTALAPPLDDLIGGRCPACGAEVTFRFDPLDYVVSELRAAFAGIYTETHALARAFGWSERAILALPRGRRSVYAELVALERAAA